MLCASRVRLPVADIRIKTTVRVPAGGRSNRSAGGLAHPYRDGATADLVQMVAQSLLLHAGFFREISTSAPASRLQ